MFFFTVYSLGLRLSEGLALRVADIDAPRARVHIRDSKGNRDRFVPRPVATLDALRRFWATRTHYRPPTCPTGVVAGLVQKTAICTQPPLQ